MPGVATAKLAAEFNFIGESSMGRGDRKTTRGKIAKRSYGNVRPHDEKSPMAEGEVRVAKKAVSKAPAKSAPAKKAPLKAATKSAAPAKKAPAKAAAKKTAS